MNMNDVMYFHGLCYLSLLKAPKQTIQILQIAAKSAGRCKAKAKGNKKSIA